MAWTRITSSDDVATILPAWFVPRMLGAQDGMFGFLLTTGDVLRFRSISAIHQSESGGLLADVLLDSAGVPHGIDLAWQPKQFLGAPVSGASLATVNLAHVVVVVEFGMAEMVAQIDEASVPTDYAVHPMLDVGDADMVPVLPPLDA